MAEETAEILEAEASQPSIASFQASMATGEIDLITGHNYCDSLAPGGRGPDGQAATTVKSGIINSPKMSLESSRRSDRQESLRRTNRLYPSYSEYEGYYSYSRYAPYERKGLFPLYPGYEGKWQLALERPDDQRHSTSYDMITSNILSHSGSTQTTATSHNLFSATNRLPSYSQLAYRSSDPYTLQQGNDLTHAHAPSDFSLPLPLSSPFPYFPSPNLDQQYSVLTSHTNTPILHQNPSLSYKPHSLPPPTPPSQDPRPDSPHLTSSTPTSTAVVDHSLAPPTSTTTKLSSQLLNTTATSQRFSYIPYFSRSANSRVHSLHQDTSDRYKLSTRHLYTPSFSTFGIPTSVTVHSPVLPLPASSIISPDADQLPSTIASPNESDHSDVHKESSRIVWQHIKQQGKLNSVCSLKMLFCGPPETGKTTTMRRLTNQIRCLDPNSPGVDSTVLDKPRTVQLIHRSSVLIADDGSWNFDESVKEQGHSIYSLIINSSHGSTTSATGSNANTPCIATADESDADDSARTASEQEAMVNRSMEKVTRLAQAEEWEEVTRLAQAGEWEEVTKKLSGIKDITILHVIDSGGQPECHEILPLLLDGQVLSLIFLDLSKNLTNKHAVSFRSSNRYAAAQSENFSPSEFTTQEVLHHILTSIMSLQSVDDGSCNSIALLVGTHLDKVSSSQVHELDLQLQDAFKHFIENGLLCSTETGDDEEESYIATLNNMTDDQEDIDRLRKLILEVVDIQFRKRQEQSIPTGWLLLHLLLRDRYQEQGWCSMADCIDIAKLCGIKEEDVPKVLDAIHKNYGTLLFYPSVIDCVICDPNVIISPLKSVLEFVFACSIRTKRAIARSIRDTGEITEKQLMECFETSSCTHLPSSSLIALFKHRYILCEITHSAGGQKKFLMPCLLRTDANVVSFRQKLFSSPAPILFVAWSQVYGCYNSPTPLGLFPAVVVDLSGTWNCTMCKVRFRNRIQFNVKDKNSGATFTVELCKYATYIELCLKHCPNTGTILATLCHQVFDSLQRVSEKYTHMKPIKWELGFYCPSSLEEGGNPHPAVLNGVGNAPIVDMTCCLCSREHVFELEEKHKCWLAKNDQSATVSVRNMQKVQQGYLRGVEAYYEETTLEVVGEKPQKLEWSGCGFYIEVPEGALPPDVTASVAVKVILAGQFELPKDSQLISAIYWVSSSKVFLKEVAVNIQHCAFIESEEQCSEFKFVVARCSQEVLPYKFREKTGLFNVNTQYATIKVKHFSFFGITSPWNTELLYMSLKFYRPIPKTKKVDYVFALVYNQDLHVKAVRQKYAKFAEDEQMQAVVFEETELELDLSFSIPTLVDKWKIQPLTYPKISKADVKQYQPNNPLVPACNIELEWMGEGKQQQLFHRVTIKGAKKPQNVFCMRYYPETTGHDNAPNSANSSSSTDPSSYSSTDHSPSSTDHQVIPTVEELILALPVATITDPVDFGLRLGVRYNRCEQLIRNHVSDIKAQVRAIAAEWYNQAPCHTWNEVVEALYKHGLVRDAVHLANKVGVKSPLPQEDGDSDHH